MHWIYICICKWSIYNISFINKAPYRIIAHLEKYCILPVWPDLTKFRHFGTILKVLGKLLKLYLVFGKILILLWQKICYWASFYSCRCPNIWNNFAIWSHWILQPVQILKTKKHFALKNFHLPIKIKPNNFHFLRRFSQSKNNLTKSFKIL